MTYDEAIRDILEATKNIEIDFDHADELLHQNYSCEMRIAINKMTEDGEILDFDIVSMDLVPVPSKSL